MCPHDLPAWDSLLASLACPLEVNSGPVLSDFYRCEGSCPPFMESLKLTLMQVKDPQWQILVIQFPKDGAYFMLNLCQTWGRDFWQRLLMGWRISRKKSKCWCSSRCICKNPPCKSAKRRGIDLAWNNSGRSSMHLIALVPHLVS